MPGSSSAALGGADLLPTPAAADHLARLEYELHQARAEADMARRHLRALTENLREGLLLLGPDQRVLVVSDQFCRLLGLPLAPAQVMGLALPPLIALMRELVADPEAYDHELTITPTAIIQTNSVLRLRTGRLLERDVRPVALCDKTGWLLSYRDVTVQREVEAQRDAQRAFYETILDEVPVEIAVFDEQQRYVYVNPQAVPDPAHREWLAGRTLTDYCTRYGFPLSLAAQRTRMFEAAEKSPETIFWDDCTPRPAGDVYHQRQFKLLSGAGRGLPYMLGSGLDVTARVQAEERSQRSEAARRAQQEFMQLVLDTNPNPVYVRDAAGEVVFGNRALFRLDEHPAALPLAPEVAQAKEREAAHYARVDAQVLATGQEVQAEECSTSPTGELRWFYTVKRPLVQPDGTVQVLGVSTDITALKAAQLAAEEAAQARENFLANMSHEIRTPMNGVLGMAALLAKTPLNPQQQEFVRTIRSSGSHLLGVLNDVLDVAKIHAGKLELEATVFDLHESMQQAVATLALQAQDQGLAFGFRPFTTGEVCWVLSDPFRLNQVLLNLLSNAIKFTNSGSVWLRSFLVGETNGELLVRFEVRDTGIGISEEALGRIFESFTQAYADTTRHYGGTGLGLTISRALVAQLGGELHVSSQLGQGSSFSFTLPLAKTQAPAPTLPDAFNTGQLRGVRVLLAEDNPINRDVARLHLLQWGVAVDEAEDGLAALALLETRPYDAVLMDIQMPGMSGLEVTQHLRQLPDARRAAVPVLALTANVFRSDNERYLAAGMDDYLAKPFAEEDLYAKLLALLRPPVAALLAPPPAYDLAHLRREARGNAAFIAGMLRSFLTHMPPTLLQLRAAAEARDWAQVAELAHFIKPNLLTLCIAEAVASLPPLEQPLTQLPTPDEPARQTALNSVLAALDTVLRELPTELEELNS
ncbi:ATP-binding protein [Hymenobacter psoromatis]|uniref:ATP-binding protein n=1 Tax=Hymenobacter psoromatis TaxID=1484116 RepID=UPI001CBC589C|nr:ATP-binding protein [Hymenobacter psoromatis]